MTITNTLESAALSRGGWSSGAASQPSQMTTLRSGLATGLFDERDHHFAHEMACSEPALSQVMHNLWTTPRLLGLLVRCQWSGVK
ncbi:MAG: hypothetical protein JWO01_2795 [Microbacteriaceae bacterium]|nr:hypothetical protein [Microbacteriaceae bacterium]